MYIGLLVHKFKWETNPLTQHADRVRFLDFASILLRTQHLSTCMSIIIATRKLFSWGFLIRNKEHKDSKTNDMYVFY
jgi:formate hydrogenlyase subunit 3/multisubunit Na+/H+ antiporter MnhD subunit